MSCAVEGSSKRHRMASSVDPDEPALYEPSHLDLHCLKKNLLSATWLKGLTRPLFHKTAIECSRCIP